MTRTLVVLGAAGFVGQEAVREAVAAGWAVKGVVRSQARARSVQEAGAQPIVANVLESETWRGELEGATGLVDLTQPKFPSRIGRSALRRAAGERLSLTRSIIEALHTLPSSNRPILIAVSGVNDLQRNEEGLIDHRSPLADRLQGLAPIGVPARRLLEDSGLDATWVYLGIVYGPGGTFAEQFVEGMRRGRLRIVGSGRNRILTVHVQDVARAIVHLAGLPREQLVGRSWVVGSTVIKQQDFATDLARLMNVKPPGKVPAWMASFVVGRALAQNLIYDVNGDASALQETGFTFRYPSHREGLAETLQQLEYARAAPVESSHKAG